MLSPAIHDASFWHEWVSHFRYRSETDIEQSSASCRWAFDSGLYFHNNGNMESIYIAERLAALGHETRLTIFRLLVEAGPGGINASAIGERLGLPAATLSFHLAHLSRVGLINGRQDSRYIFYSADYAAMDDLIAFLTHNCCQGNACLPQTVEVSTTIKRRNNAAKKKSIPKN